MPQKLLETKYKLLIKFKGTRN